MQVGEKYLSVKISGLPEFFTAFPNPDKKEKQPDFQGDGIAVWIRKKQAPTEKIKATL